ncbi:MAG: hypothetical protein HOV83_17005 [Catenulispora sp.]|nr:hypothetical protein [Catenulispora sp.]
MPKIDWTPGLGRRGRPLRRILGMGQRQGLIVLFSLAAVMVLVATISALGGFDDAPSASERYAGGAQNVDGAGGVPVVNDGAKGSAKAVELLQASTQHYSDLFAAGQKIIGTTRYADPAAYGRAYADPKSPAAQFVKYRQSPNPESDTSYLQTEDQAAAAYGGRPKALRQWSSDMSKVKWDLGDWVAAAARFQRGEASQAELDAAAAKVTQDLAAAKGDVGGLAG